MGKGDGASKCMLYLAYSHEFGNGTPVDLDKARKFYARAYTLGQIDAETAEQLELRGMLQRPTDAPRIVESKAKRKRCGFCQRLPEDAGDGKSFPRCKGCLKIYYCSEKCQKEDWKRHRLECPAWLEKQKK